MECSQMHRLWRARFETRMREERLMVLEDIRPEPFDDMEQEG